VIVEPIIPQQNNFGHPTPKLVKVMRHLVDCLTSPGDTILDPFMGSAQPAWPAYKQVVTSSGSRLTLDISK